MRRWPIIRHIRYWWLSRQFCRWWLEVGQYHWLAPNQLDLEYLDRVWRGEQ